MKNNYTISISEWAKHYVITITFDEPFRVGISTSNIDAKIGAKVRIEHFLAMNKIKTSKMSKTQKINDCRYAIKAWK